MSWASEHPTPPSNALWSFTPAGQGGSWSQVFSTSQSNFSSLSRTYGGASASGNGPGFVLGGVQDGQTSTSLDDYVYASGLLGFNSTSGEWYNVSAHSYSQDGTAIQASAHFVPEFGPNGLFFVLVDRYLVDVMTFKRWILPQSASRSRIQCNGRLKQPRALNHLRCDPRAWREQKVKTALTRQVCLDQGGFCQLTLHLRSFFMVAGRMTTTASMQL